MAFPYPSVSLLIFIQLLFPVQRIYFMSDISETLQSENKDAILLWKCWLFAE